MKKSFLAIIVIIGIFSNACNDSEDQLNDYIVAGEFVENEHNYLEQNIQIQYMGDMEDASHYLDLNNDGINDVLFFCREYSSDSLYYKQVGLKSLGNTEFAYSIVHQDTLHFLQYVYSENDDLVFEPNPMCLESGELINSDLDWQESGFEIVCYMESVKSYESGQKIIKIEYYGPFEYSYIPVRIHANGVTHYAWLEHVLFADHPESGTGVDYVRILSSACTQFYSEN